MFSYQIHSLVNDKMILLFFG